MEPWVQTMESLLDLCGQCSRALGQEPVRTEGFERYDNFASYSWYNRVHFWRGEEELFHRLDEIYRQAGNPKVFSFQAERCGGRFCRVMEESGLRLMEEQRGMVLPLDGAKGRRDAHVRRIRREELPSWVEVSSAAFGAPCFLKPYEIQYGNPQNIFYGYFLEDGTLAGTNHLNLCGDNGGIHEVAVRPEYRGKGIATALMNAAVEDAKQAGCRVMSLQASSMGEPVYRRLGFQMYDTIFNYCRR